jgi:hypothetical protein
MERTVAVPNDELLNTILRVEDDPITIRPKSIVAPGPSEPLDPSSPADHIGTASAVALTVTVELLTRTTTV